VVKSGVKSGDFSLRFPLTFFAHLHARCCQIGRETRRAPPGRDVAKDTATTEKAARKPPRREKAPRRDETRRRRKSEAEETEADSSFYSPNITVSFGDGIYRTTTTTTTNNNNTP